MTDIQFWTTLIEVTRPANGRAIDALCSNCTYVRDDFWIMEGDVDYLRDEGVTLREVAEGSVGALGELSEDRLVEVCRASFGVDLSER